MARVLAHDVHVTDEDLEVTVLPAGSVVPRKFKKFVTNPNAYVDVEAPAEEADQSEDQSADESKE